MNSKFQAFREFFSREHLQEAHTEATRVLENELLDLRGQIRELRNDDLGWVNLSRTKGFSLPKNTLNAYSQKSWLYWLQNPLIRQAVELKTLYTFGLGFDVHAVHEKINDVVQEFWDDPKNKAELTSAQALMEKERQLQIEANVFFAFFEDKPTGCLRVRTIPFHEISEILYNPEDRKDPWWYKREIFIKNAPKVLWYKDWHYTPKEGDATPEKDFNEESLQEAVIYHVSTNRPPDMSFGIPEVYTALRWANAYKEFLTSWIKIVKAYEKFAWMVTGGDKGDAEAIKGKLAGADKEGVKAGVGVLSGEMNMQPVRTAGATTSMDDARRLLLMVCASVNIFEHYFGDPATGNLATATSMEKPMEIMFKNRQSLWEDVLDEILQYQIDRRVRATKAPEGLRATVITEEKWGGIVEKLVLPLDVENKDPEMREQEITRTINKEFPDFMEDKVKDRVDAIVSAITLNGSSPAGVIPDVKEQSRRILQALGEDHIDEKLDQFFADDLENEEPEEPTGTMPSVPPATPEEIQAEQFRTAHVQMKVLSQEVEKVLKNVEGKIKEAKSEVQ